jgi:hypothetical protein
MDPAGAGFEPRYVILLHLAVIITLSIAAVAAYIYFGSAKIATIAEINSEIAGRGDSAKRSLSSLGAPALAFLAGYGVEAVFRKLDGLAGRLSPGRK